MTVLSGSGVLKLAFAWSLVGAPAVAFADAGHGSASVGKPGVASPLTRTVTIEVGDSFYEPGAVRVKAGETVRFVLKNDGEFLHEFNIGTPGMHAEHQKEMAMMMEHGMLTPTGIDQAKMSMDHGSMGSMKHDDPNSVLIEPGQTKELVWTFAEPAVLEFACNIPGHYESGMVGEVQFR